MWSSSSTGKNSTNDTPNKGVIEMIVRKTATADLAPPTAWRRLTCLALTTSREIQASHCAGTEHGARTLSGREPVLMIQTTFDDLLRQAPRDSAYDRLMTAKAEGRRAMEAVAK